MIGYAPVVKLEGVAVGGLGAVVCSAGLGVAWWINGSVH